MDFWQRARSIAEEAAKRSTELTKGIGSAKIADVVNEASKKSKEFAAEASKKIAAETLKRADQIKAETLKRADQIKSQLPPAAAALSQLVSEPPSAAVQSAETASAADLETFGVTDELREFVKEITSSTFQDFPLPDDNEMSDIPTVSNVRQDLTKWQERHAKLVLSTVKEISKLRYELCPRVMKERKFWRIYFILVNSHVAPYEKRYMEEAKKKSVENVGDNVAKDIPSVASTSSSASVEGANQKNKKATSSASDQDLDVFLLGDPGDSDDGPDDGDDGFDDDFDKI